MKVRLELPLEIRLIKGHDLVRSFGPGAEITLDLIIQTSTTGLFKLRGIWIEYLDSLRRFYEEPIPSVDENVIEVVSQNQMLSKGGSLVLVSEHSADRMLDGRPLDERYYDRIHRELLLVGEIGLLKLCEAKLFRKTLRHLTEYKRRAEKGGKILRGDLEREKDFRKDLEIYLKEGERLGDKIAAEVELPTGDILDLLVDNKIIIECKWIDKGKKTLIQLMKEWTPQIKSYIVELEKTIGFVIFYDNRKQEKIAYPPRLDDFRLTIVKGGKNVDPSESVESLLIFGLMVRGGERTSAHEMHI